VSRADQRVKRLYWNVRLLGLPEPMRDVWMLALTVVLVVLAVNASSDAAHNTHALCALRHDLEARVTAGEALLRKHPRGIAGIPAPTLQTTLKGQRRTIDALSNLTCPPSP
jgi:hypothetical protein